MRRIVFYLFFDPAGRVDDYVLHKLSHLRDHAEHIFVVSNSPLDDANRARMESVADTVWVRENVGFDVWAYKEAMKVFGADRLTAFDELILMNYTFFGPIGSFDPVFSEMDANADIDFWGVTDHGDYPAGATGDKLMFHRHIQSHWIAVRRRLFTSEPFREYWDDMPMITSYHDSITRHEGRFTHHFSELGYRFAVAFPADRYPSQHPIMDNPVLVVGDGSPIVKRRTFFHDPLYLDKHAVLGRDLIGVVEDRGYPVDLIYSNLARTSVPRNLSTNMGLLEILPDVDLNTYDRSQDLRVAAVLHIYYVDMTEALLDRLEMLPSGFDLFVTTTDSERSAEIVSRLAARGVTADVRIVDSNQGRDISAFFIGCRDVIESDDYDLIVKLHSKASPQDDFNLGDLFKRHLFENLLSSPGYASNVLGLFQRYESLGIVFPPVIHVGYPTMGHGWFANKPRAQEEAARLGITVPFDESTPLATYGSMFIARPAALRPIAAGDYEYGEFPSDGDYRDGTLAHALERLVAYSALSEGYHARQVLTADFASIYYSYLEYKLQSVAALLPAEATKQRGHIKKITRQARAGQAAKRAAARRRADVPSKTSSLEDAPPLAAIKATVVRGYPRLAAYSRRPYRIARSAAGLVRRARRRVRR